MTSGDEHAVNHCGYVALIGRPNVGKSTLLNRILGQKLAITCHKAQTTRHAVLGVRCADNGQAIIVDTPGLHRRGRNALNRYLNRTARSVAADVDLVLFVLEALRFTSEDAAALASLAELECRIIAVVNKVDCIKDKARLLPYLSELAARHDFLEIVPVSALNGDQVERLVDLVIEALPERANRFPDDQLTDLPSRFFAAEFMREQLIRRYGDELPYATTVEVEHFEEADTCYRIDLVVWVERPAQKAIIIGRQGQALKAAASQARLEMEKLFDCSVYLKVWVKVKKAWSSDEHALASLGYQSTRPDSD